MSDPLCTVPNRIAGALLGMAGGAAWGRSSSAGDAERRRDAHVELAIALARTYVEGYSLPAVADAFRAALDTEPTQVDPTTAVALAEYRRSGDPRSCGRATEPGDASGVVLGRCVATGLVRMGSARRAREAAEIAALTHADRRCVESCVAYCDLVAALVAGEVPVRAVVAAAARGVVGTEVRRALSWGRRLPACWVPAGPDVLEALAAAVWALCQPERPEHVLDQLVALGAGSTALAAAGGLLGAAQGLGSLSEGFVRGIEQRRVLLSLTPQLFAARRPAAGMAAARLVGSR
jgi:ADP-ribosyl-[dinitrogen reductase] hydrolase